MALQETVRQAGEVPRDQSHESLVGRPGRAGDVHAGLLDERRGRPLLLAMDPAGNGEEKGPKRATVREHRGIRSALMGRPGRHPLMTMSTRQSARDRQSREPVLGP